MRKPLSHCDRYLKLCIWFALRFEMPSIDRTNGLPENVQCHILSFLPIRRTVSTSILSKRWTNIWRNVSTLIFIDFLYGQKAYFLFNEFVYSLLLSRNYIKSFTFRIGYDYPRFGLFLFQISSNGSMLWYNTEFSTSIFPKWMLILTCLLAFWAVEPLLFLNVTESLWMWRV